MIGQWRYASLILCRTDEQAPIPSVFDHLLQLAWRQEPGSPAAQAIYNCQMGRGRTTTGMVISVLIHLVHANQLMPSPETSLTTALEEMTVSPEEVRERHLAGEYKLISQVLTVLDHGKRAKRLVDAAIDRCSHIQNLRTAIYDFKLQDSGERGLNYLLRYFFLIVFAEYLVEKRLEQESETEKDLGADAERQKDRHGPRPRPGPRPGPGQGQAQSETETSLAHSDAGNSFVGWLAERREITNMVARRELIDF